MPDQSHRFAILAGRTRRVLLDLELIGRELAEIDRFGLASKLLDVELEIADLYLELSNIAGQPGQSPPSQHRADRTQQAFPF